jgi:primosomal protein N' (replication factor Y)
VVGAGRTAEELGRAFPSVPVVSSGGAKVLGRVGSRPALVVATPGAEPVADDGYAAALLLDGWLLLSRPDLRAGEETLRRWLAATALVRPASDGGRVVLMAPPGARAAQALVRGDPFGAADRELADRVSAALPPATRVATITGEAAAVAELLALTAWPDGAEVLGPVSLGPDDDERALVRAPRAGGTALAGALHDALAVRSARKSPGAVRVQVDPLELG